VRLRDAGLAALRSYDNRSLKAQLKLADRSGARYAVIVGPREVEDETVTVRLLEEGKQTTVRREELVEWMRREVLD
jgi:histidyl-tRNA synthetase